MKDLIRIFIIFSVLLLVIPTIVLSKDKEGEKVTESIATLENVLVLDSKSGDITQIALRDYLIGCVLAQIPFDYSPETLKAQAVICRTYIYHRRLAQISEPTKELNGADVSTDYTIYQKYFSPSQAQSYYGDDYKAAYDACAMAVDKTKGEILVYEKSPIITAFHALSCGSTESSLNAWGVDIPYLVSVQSEGDKDAPNSVKEYDFTKEEILARLTNLDISGSVGDDFALETVKLSESGNVLEITLTNEGQTHTLSGSSFAAALNMRSACFEMTESEDGYHFSCVGVGHMVGMSQYGADCMAQEGADYKTILTHYFSGIELKDLL